MRDGKIPLARLIEYDHVLVYGAGAVGTRLLRVLMQRRFPAEKLIVWDARAKRIGKRFGYPVSDPDFTAQYDVDGVRLLVVVALSPVDNADLVEELKERFLSLGYPDVIGYGEIDFVATKVSESAFVNRPAWDFSHQENRDFSGDEPQVKPIAFYLPQFHEIPENNEWWGAGFTEWVNTRKAKPRFQGHYQPREPHDDFGYYDLSDVKVIRKQAELAKQHGIYGWSFYYYWFSGRTLLAKPIDLLLEHLEIDIHYCLQWCNHNWTKSWVGNERKELIRCEYRDDDPERFIDDIVKYLRDPRYIRVDGKPLVIVFRYDEIPDAKGTVARWRARAREIGIGEIAVFSCIHSHTIKDIDITGSTDGDLYFNPIMLDANAVQLLDKDDGEISAPLSYSDEIIQNFRETVEHGDHTSYVGCMGGWDNTPRYKRGYQIYDLGFSLRKYYDAARYAAEEAVRYGKEYVFYFAWNEWAEGAYLEPDKKYGYALINTFSKAICGLPFEDGDEQDER